MKVMKMAKAINPTGQTKSRLDENIENLQEWIDNSCLLYTSPSPRDS